jgi:dUTP pyrophosphatase
MTKTRGFEVVRDEARKHGELDIQLPVRGSQFSAGYDFFTPTDVTIKAGSKELVWTDVKAYMLTGEVLLLDVRSSIGIKKGLTLANTIGVIDTDYYGNGSNDGNIGICLRNLSNEDVTLEAGERIAQGIFVPFLVADNGNTEKEREGGIGSTGTK